MYQYSKNKYLLQAMFTMVQQYVDNEDVVGSVGDGKPLTKQQLIEEVRTAYQEHKEGKIHSQEAVTLQIENW